MGFRFSASTGNDTLGLTLALGTSHTTFLVLNLASRNILMGENAVNRYIEAQAAATAYVTAGETATQAMAWTLSTWYVFGIRRGVDQVEFRRNGAVVGTQDLGTGGDGITLANLSGPLLRGDGRGRDPLLFPAAHGSGGGAGRRLPQLALFSILDDE
jgi:hypothetical protein